MFNISPAPAALAKRLNKVFSSASVMFSRLRPPLGFGLRAFTQQYHLNALPLSLGHFPMQCRLQLPNLAFRAFDHPSLPKQMATGNHTISLAGGTELPQTRRFNQLWKWYYRQFDANRLA